MSFNIKFGEQKAENIFSDIALKVSEQIKRDSSKNKTTQLRKFYDELTMWNEKIQLNSKNKRNEEYKKLAPFIKMLKAKVAYARGRGYVDDNFIDVFNECIDAIHSPETLRDAKLFMEAVMGFCKFQESKKAKGIV